MPKAPTSRRPRSPRGRAPDEGPGATPTPHYRVETYRLDESVGFMIVALATHLDRTLDQKLRALDTSVAQWKVLSALSNGRAESAADLARLFGADTGALTRLLDRMESAELLARRPHPHDRRQHQLALTRRGQALMKQVPPLIVDDLNTRLAAFTPAEVGQLKTLLRKLMDGSRPLGLSVGPPERTEATEG